MTDGWEGELSRYFAFMESEGRTKGTTKSARSILNGAGRFLRPRSFRDLTEDDVRGWVAALRERDMSPSGVSSYMTRFRAFLRWLDPKGETPDCLRRVTIKGGESRIKSEGDLLPDKELDRVLARLSPFWRTAALVLRYTGARPDEVLRLRTKDLASDDGRVRISIPMSKSGRPRVVPLVEARAVQALRAHLDHLEPGSPWVFPSPVQGHDSVSVTGLRLTMKDAARRARVDPARVFPYMLRHMRASQLARMSVPQAVADRLMGWKPGSITWANYTHFAVDDIEAALLEIDEVADLGPSLADEIMIELRKITSDPAKAKRFLGVLEKLAAAG